MICSNLEKVQVRTQVVVPKSVTVTLNDLGQYNGCYFMLFHRIWKLWGPVTITSNWL